MLESEYKANLLKFHHQIMALPTTELKYHLYLLLVSLNNNNTEYTRDVLECAIELTKHFQDFFTQEDVTNRLILQINFLNHAFENLVTIAETNTNMVVVNSTIRNIGGSIAGFATGIVGGFIGGFSGFVRGLWNREQLFTYSWTGGVVGSFLGAVIGFRTPPKLLQDPQFRQIKYALDGLTETYTRIGNGETEFGMETYLEDAYDFLLENHFHNNKKNLDDYLNNDHVEYEIGTWGAEFVSPILAGSVGHHAFIRVNINGKYHGMEFTPFPSDFNTPPLQSETRIVSGKKIQEMIAFHLSLQNTESFTAWFFVTKLKPGERDCFSYVNKLLIGTSQEPTCLTRYHKNDKAAGYAVRFFIENLAVFPNCLRVQDEEQTLDTTNLHGESCLANSI